jgi:hypothetical protein
MRKALVVGIDYYEYMHALFGCVGDAHSVRSVLERHSDGSVNFDVILLSGSAASQSVSRSNLRDHIRALFTGNCEIALLFFAGHGHLEDTGGYLIASDSESGDEGVPIRDIFTWADSSPAGNRVIVLDSCHSGIAGASSSAPASASIKEGTTIFTASTSEQYASEEEGAGVFTTLFVDALSGAAGNLVGDVTPGSVYAHIDQSLGSWGQRPVFKTNVQRFVSLRTVQAPISQIELRRITEFFPSRGFEFQLDPSFEPERGIHETSVPMPIPENAAKFAVLQKYNRVNLVVPVDAPHMWHAAMGSKACKLTVLGEHYRRLVEKGRI